MVRFFSTMSRVEIMAGGDAVKMAKLAQETGQVPESIGVTLVERATGLWVLFILALLALPFAIAARTEAAAIAEEEAPVLALLDVPQGGADGAARRRLLALLPDAEPEFARDLDKLRALRAEAPEAGTEPSSRGGERRDVEAPGTRGDLTH